MIAIVSKAFNWSSEYELSDDPNVDKQDWNSLDDIVANSDAENESGETFFKISQVREAILDWHIDFIFLNIK